MALDARASLALAPALASPAALWRAVAHASLASTASSLPAGLAALGRRLAEDAGAQPLFAAYALGFMLPASLVQVAAMNSWINMSWPFFPGVHTLRLHWALRPTQWVARALRATCTHTLRPRVLQGVLLHSMVVHTLRVLSSCLLLPPTHPPIHPPTLSLSLSPLANGPSAVQLRRG